MVSSSVRVAGGPAAFEGAAQIGWYYVERPLVGVLGDKTTSSNGWRRELTRIRVGHGRGSDADAGAPRTTDRRAPRPVGRGCHGVGVEPGS